MRLYSLIGPTHAAKRIGLTDQARELSQRIALALGWRALVTAAVMVVIRGKRAVLISISHRDDASPSGKPSTHPFKRTGPPPDAPTDPHLSGARPNYRISSGAWTPRTAKPDARTETTP